MRKVGIKNFTLGSFNVSLDGGNGIGSQRSNSGVVEQLLPMWLTGGVRIR